jgi:hypothetical protein
VFQRLCIKKVKEGKDGQRRVEGSKEFVGFEQDI